MIQSLRIVNFILIDELEICFRNGMNVLSGETGAGKSIVVDAVNLILGSRSDRSLIRSGCDKAVIEAVFLTEGREDISRIMKRESIEYDGQSVTIYRELTQSGRNLCRICGVIVSLNLLAEIGRLLMDIHGQHEHQFLMDPLMHMSYLDRMGDSVFQAQLAETGAACEKFLSVHRTYLKLRKENEQKQNRITELEKDLQELNAAKLRIGEEEELQKECLRLRNTEKIVSVLRSARDALSLGVTEESSLDRIKSAMASLHQIENYGSDTETLARRCESAYYELEEIAYEISSLIDQSDSDPQRLEKAEGRLDLIRKLERKHGGTITEVLQEKERQEKEYELLCSLEDKLEECARSHKQSLAAYRQASRTLSAMRRQLAARLENDLKDQLKDLGMEKTVFRVRFEPEEDRKPMPKPTGDDRLEFLISPNPGEPLRPLAKIASGGELSRLMLAMKTLESQGNGADCMVFDEIDTGISGRMAQAVAEKMISIARTKQVICVTHLPQIAAAAGHQFLVEKNSQEDRTHTTIRELDPEGRIEEVARMISGAEGISGGAREYACSMIEACEKKKTGVS